MSYKYNNINYFKPQSINQFPSNFLPAKMNPTQVTRLLQSAVANREGPIQTKINPADGSIHLKNKGLMDGNEYTIRRDGSVIRSGGWSNPELMLPAGSILPEVITAAIDPFTPR